MGTYDIIDYGAVGDGSHNDAAAIQAAIDACTSSGGGRVLVPAGRTFLTGLIEIKSNVELHLEAGSTILSSPEVEHYKTEHDTRGVTFLVYAHHARNVAITGLGTIDGNGREFIAGSKPHIHLKKPVRPYTVGLIGCEGVTLRDVRITDAAHWTVTLVGCEDAVINGVRILNDMRMPNSDGIDLERCRNVRISDCHIEAGDDCIVLKTNKRWKGYGPCENVTITGCTMVSNSFAINLGCEVKEPIRNVIVDSCVVRNSHRGVGIHLSEESDIENVIFSNLVIETRYRNPDWWGAAEPIYIAVLPWTDENSVGVARNIRFSNILCRGENGVFVYGESHGSVEDLVFENVRVEVDKWTDEPGGRHDIRPVAGASDGRDAGVYQHPTAGFYLKNATDVTIRNCTVRWGPNRPDYFRHALEAHAVRNLVLEGFSGEAAFPGRDPATLVP